MFGCCFCPDCTHYGGDGMNADPNETMRNPGMAMFSKKSGNGGFSMVENIVAIFVIVVAMLGLISTSVMVVKANSFAKTMTTATTLAQDKIESMKNTRYADLASGSDTVQSFYTRRWTVTGDLPAASMKTIEVRVEWSWQGSVHDVTVKSIVSNSM